MTHKYTPTQGFFYLSYPELLPIELEKKKETEKEEGVQGIAKKFQQAIGKERAQIVKEAKIFQVGSGAIGCELLKNLAYSDAGS